MHTTRMEVQYSRQTVYIWCIYNLKYDTPKWVSDTGIYKTNENCESVLIFYFDIQSNEIAIEIACS